MLLKKLVETRRFREAVECYHASEAEARRDPECQLLAADAAARLGELSLGQQLATAASEEFASSEQHPGLMRACNLMGAIAFERGQLVQAGRCFSRTVQLARRHFDWHMVARVSNNLATLSHIGGAAQAAVPLYQESAQLFQKLQDTRGGAEASHNLSLLYRQLGRLEEADAAAAKAVSLAGQAHDRSLLALAVLGQSEIAIERGFYAMAGRLIVRGAALAAESGDQLNGIEAGRLRALVTLRQGDFALAHHLAEVAASIAGSLGSGLLRAECAALAALALWGQGKSREAGNRREEAVAAFQDFGAQASIHRFELEWAAAM